MSAVVFDGISKSYGETRVVKEFNLEIESGEFLVFVGPSGCGKTTSLRMLAGLEAVSDGRIFIDGKDVTDVAPKDRDLAMVFQSYALYPHKTVRQNMSFALELARVDKAEIARRIAKAADLLGLTDYLDRRPANLSGGQRQRVAVGRAIVRDPKVFLFDEPLSNLDAKLRTTMRSELIKLHRQIGATMVYVTHDQVEAMTMGDRIVVMNGGEIQQVASPIELYDNPANAFVAGFIGSPAMNFFEVRRGASGRSVGLGDAEVPLPEGHPALSANAVRLGIRPEHFEIGDGPLEARIDVVEHLGAETMLEVTLAGAPATLRSRRNDAARAGDEIRLTARPEHILAFDAQSGASLR